jgi:hypothetical protein
MHLASTKPKILEILEIIVASCYATRGTPEHCQLELVPDGFLIALVGRLWKNPFPVLFRTTTEEEVLQKKPFV